MDFVTMTLQEHLGDTSRCAKVGIDLESATIEEVAGQAVYDVIKILVGTITISRAGPQGYSPGTGPST
jgi:hypothetical protein